MPVEDSRSAGAAQLFVRCRLAGGRGGFTQAVVYFSIASSSTSKVRVALGGTLPPAPRSP